MMVSNKIIVLLFVFAIVLSIVSIVVTISTLNSSSISEPKLNSGDVIDSQGAQVGLIINKPSNENGSK